MKVWCYVFTYQDPLLMKYYCMHFSWVDKIIVYDNESTDATREVAKKFPNVEVRTYSTGGTCDDTIMIRLINNVWKEARGKVDWCIVSYLDEMLYNPDLPKKLQTLLEQDYTVVKGYNYWMRCNELPVGDTPITEQVRTGVRSVGEGFDKIIAIRPDYFFEMNYVEGMHSCQPQPNGKPLKIYHADDIKILHYKYVGRERCRARGRMYRTRLSENNRKGGFAVRWLELNDKELDEFAFPSGGDGNQVI